MKKSAPHPQNHGHSPTMEKKDDHAPKDHEHHEGHDPNKFRDKFWLVLLLTLPVVFWSEHIQMIFGYHAPVFTGSDWISPFLGTIIYFYGGWVFIQGAIGELKKRLPGMMTLITLAISVAFLFSWIVQLGLLRTETLWWELATLITIMLLGHWIEMRSVRQAKGALKELAKLLPDNATRLNGQDEEIVTLAELVEGDMILVRPGEKIPVDGLLRKGKSEVNEAMITGESRPVKKDEGDEMIAGTINGEGSLHIEVTGTGDGTKLSKIMRLVKEAQQSKSRAQHLADRAALLLTVVAIAAAVITFIVWQLLGAAIDFTIIRVVTVLVIACPHALGLAVPLVVAISTTLGAKGGLLVRDRRGLEEARNIDTIIFDKTGTLTLGEFRVVEIITVDEITEKEALQVAAGVEKESEHPIARGIVNSANDRDLDIPLAEGFQSYTGRGVSASIEGIEYYMGGYSVLTEQNVTLPKEFESAVQKASEKGQAVIYLLKNDRVLAMFTVADQIREESRTAIATLHKQGLTVVMLTGDARDVAENVAAELGIDEFYAEVLPEDKAAKVNEIQRGGRRVAMVGDGVNDAPALATADIGIAIGAGTDVAVEAGHIVLVRSDPRDISRIIALSKATYRKMLQNLWWAAGYNIAAIPLAAGTLSHWGIMLTPAAGAVLMSASTVIVAFNAQLLWRTKL